MDLLNFVLWVQVVTRLGSELGTVHSAVSAVRRGQCRSDPLRLISDLLKFLLAPLLRDHQSLMGGLQDIEFEWWTLVPALALVKVLPGSLRGSESTMTLVVGFEITGLQSGRRRHEFAEIVCSHNPWLSVLTCIVGCLFHWFWHFLGHLLNLIVHLSFKLDRLNVMFLVWPSHYHLRVNVLENLLPARTLL